LYSTVRKDTSYNNIGTPGSAGKQATAKTPSIACNSRNASTAGRKATKGKPTTPGTPIRAGNPATSEQLEQLEHQKLKGCQQQQKY
jgi:hypothetical protein